MLVHKSVCVKQFYLPIPMASESDSTLRPLDHAPKTLLWFDLVILESSCEVNISEISLILFIRLDTYIR